MGDWPAAGEYVRVVDGGDTVGSGTVVCVLGRLLVWADDTSGMTLERMICSFVRQPHPSVTWDAEVL